MTSSPECVDDQRGPTTAIGESAATARDAPTTLSHHASTRSPLLLDEFTPHFDVAVVHSHVLRAVPAECYRAATEVDLYRAPPVRALLGIRALPRRVARKLRLRHAAASTPGTSPDSFRLMDLVDMGWLLLGETPGVELVLGQVSQPWRSIADATEGPTTPDQFINFDEPGYAKIAAGLRIDCYGNDSSIMTIETRVALTDESRRRFKRYWLIVEPFSSLIRRLAFRLVTTEIAGVERIPPSSGAAVSKTTAIPHQ